MHKKISLSNDLIYINLISWILAAIIFSSNFEDGSSIGVLRIILGLPFVLFFPGYTLLAALFPGRGDLEGIERVALSFGLSIAVVPLLGLGLNYTPWGIRLAPILITLLVFIAGTSALAFYRRNKLAVSRISNLDPRTSNLEPREGAGYRGDSQPRVQFQEVLC